MSDMSDDDNGSALSPETHHEYEEYDYCDYEVKGQSSLLVTAEMKTMVRIVTMRVLLTVKLVTH